MPQQIDHGKALVIERGCAACHEINGVKKPDNFAPELTAVGSRPLAKILFAPGVGILCRTTSPPRSAIPGRSETR